MGSWLAMRRSIVLPILFVLCFAGCARQASQQDAAEGSIARSCDPLSAISARKMVRPEREFSHAHVSYAPRVRSIDVENFDIVEVEFKINGSRPQPGVWAIGFGAEKGVGFALNDVASRASSWPTSSSDPVYSRLFRASSLEDASRCS